MDFQSHLFLLLLLRLLHNPSTTLAQQPYIGSAFNNCGNTDNSTSVFGYTCNGQFTSCQSYLLFRSQPPYNTLSSISALLSSSPSLLSRLNAASPSADAHLPTDQEVLVPITCSCSGPYYQSNTSYTIQSGNTLFIIANNTFQGLSTCQAIQRDNNNVLATDLVVGNNLTVPLRCACPTPNQTATGVKFLLSYLVKRGDDVTAISDRFGVDPSATLNANGLSSTSATIFPLTTLLLPLKSQPTANQTRTTPSLPPPPPPLPPSGGSTNKTWIYVVSGVGALALVFIAIASVVLFARRRSKKRRARPIPVPKALDKGQGGFPKKLPQTTMLPEEFVMDMSSIDHSLKVYTLEELRKATGNFSSDSQIKGSVYRGVINGDLAAIKKIEGDVHNEIAVLKRINHSNLIRLSGVCFSEGFCYMVYEYAENGPLSDWIIDDRNSSSKVLRWAERVQIALDVANGLNYLHSFTEPALVHKNITSSNILLDGDLRAKIANFGMSRPTQRDDEYALTRHIVGTIGYMAPEYLEHGLISSKLDVYALGVVMLEMITGKLVNESSPGDLLPESLGQVLSSENAKEKLCDFIDPSLGGNYPSDMALNMAQLIKRSLSKDLAVRPSTDEMVQSLTKILGVSLSWELSFRENKFQSFDDEDM